MSVLLGPLLRIANNQPLAVLAGVLMICARHLLLCQHPLHDTCRLFLDSCTEDILVASLTKQIHIGLVQKAGICHYDKVLDVETLDEVIYDGNHRAALILRPVEDGVRQGIAVSTDQQSQDNLRLRGLPVL